MNINSQGWVRTEGKNPGLANFVMVETSLGETLEDGIKVQMRADEVNWEYVDWYRPLTMPVRDNDPMRNMSETERENFAMRQKLDEAPVGIPIDDLRNELKRQSNLGKVADGRKDDAGKTRLGLVIGDFHNALEMVGQVGTFGAKKYAPSNWLIVPDAIDRYSDAMYRHLLAAHSENKFDDESKLLHLAHAAWCVLATLELVIRDMKNTQEREAAAKAAWENSKCEDCDD